MVLDRVDQVAGTRASSSLRLSPLQGSVCPSLSSTLHIANHLGMGREGKGGGQIPKVLAAVSASQSPSS